MVVSFGGFFAGRDGVSSDEGVLSFFVFTVSAFSCSAFGSLDEGPVLTGGPLLDVFVTTSLSCGSNVI